MKILIVEPFFSGSHQRWINDYRHFSSHQVDALTLPGKFWKWRMHGGAVTLARQFLEGKCKPDLLLFSDMLDVCTFLALTRSQTAGLPSAIYFHENQLTYPISDRDTDLLQNRDQHYGFINFTSALACDAILFNSEFHRRSFFTALKQTHSQYPDFRELDSISKIEQRSSVLNLGLDLQRFNKFKISINNQKPLILWNHRWEYDKNPEDFFEVLEELKKNRIDFELVFLGENAGTVSPTIERALKRFSSQIVHAGYLRNPGDYAKWLWKADLLPVTSRQDFFGAGIMEAIYCNCTPLLPKRLSYPELYGELEKERLFYDNLPELVEKLSSRITKRDFPAFSKLVAKFDWRELAPVYDELFAILSRK